VEGSRILVTGASGFLGRHLVEALSRGHEVIAISRASPSSRGMAIPAGVQWEYLDVADEPAVQAAFARLRRAGPVPVLLHLAGHYDFTGEPHPEYQRTNVEGTRIVLEAARVLGVRDLLFASSLAACGFPAAGSALVESSPADGDTPYAASKRAGEALVAAHQGAFRAWTVRFAALFSDWCEYEPLYRFLEVWLSDRPRRRILAGQGLSAVPYLHVRDAVSFVQRLLDRRTELDPRELLLASSDGATSHRELFEAATASHLGERERPLLLSRSLCRSAIWLRVAAERLGMPPAFERPWMGRFIDLQLRANAAATRSRLDWAPRSRLAICRRMPFLIQHRKATPSEWQRRNHAVARRVRLYENLHVHFLLASRARQLAAALVGFVLDPQRGELFRSLQHQGRERLEREVAALEEALFDSIRSGDKASFGDFCRELALQRRREGLRLEALVGVLDALSDLCVVALSDEDANPGWNLALYDHVTMTVQFGSDGVWDVYEEES